LEGEEDQSKSNFNDNGNKDDDDDEEVVYTKGEIARIRYLRAIEFAILNAFQSACSAGPLCGEPVRGVGYFIDDILIYSNSKPSSMTHHNNVIDCNQKNENQSLTYNDDDDDDDDGGDSGESFGGIREEEMMIDLATLRSTENYDTEELNSRFFKGSLTSTLAIGFRNAIMMSNGVKGATNSSSSSSSSSSSFSSASYSSTLLGHVKQIAYQSNHLMANLLNLKGRSPLRLVEPFYHSDILVSGSHLLSS
jgi:hypothetical protein